MSETHTSSNGMTDAERLLLKAVERRALLLARLARNMSGTTYLPAVLAFTATNLIRTLFGLCGEELQREILRKLVGDVLDAHNICRFCGQHPKPDPIALMCTSCDAQTAKEDREMEELAALERPTGRPQ